MPKAKKSSPKKAIRNLASAAKQTRKQASNIGKTVKTIQKGIKSLSGKPKKAASKKSTPKKTATKKTRLSPSYKVVQMPLFAGKTWAQMMKIAQSSPEKIDALKKPDEVFIGTVFGNQTRQVFNSGATLFRVLDRYVEDYKGSGGKRELIKGFGIMRFAGSPSVHAVEVDNKRKARKVEVQEIRKGLAKRFGSRLESGKTKNFTDYIQDSMRENDALSQRLRDLEDRISAMLSESKPAKKAKKKPAKKAAKKVAKKAAVKHKWVTRGKWMYYEPVPTKKGTKKNANGVPGKKSSSASRSANSRKPAGTKKAGPIKRSRKKVVTGKSSKASGQRKRK